jgi:putative ABC transport system permease protein
MIRQMLKLIWNRKSSNAFLMAEFLLTFLVLDAILAAGFSAWRQYRQPNGFSIDNVLNITGREAGSRSGGQDREQIIGQITRALQNMDAIREVGLMQWSLYEGSRAMYSQEINGKLTMLCCIRMTDECERALSMDVVQGRWFTAGDESEEVHPVVITQRLRNALFGDADPIGKTFRDYRVVGVVSDFRIYGELEKPEYFVIERYRWGESGGGKNALLVKLKSPSTAELEARILAVLQSIAPPWTFYISRAEDLHAAKLKTQAAPYILAGMASSILVIMVMLGLMGVLWQNITRRTREIGLRRANGATVKHIFIQIIGEMLLLATAGIIPGILIITQLLFLGRFGYISHSIHVAAIITAAGALYGIVALCSLYPGYMATRVPPAAALHYE